MKIRMNEMTPEGKILNRGEVVIGETALEIVQGMMRDNPYMNDQTETAYMGLTLARIGEADTRSRTIPLQRQRPFCAFYGIADLPPKSRRISRPRSPMSRCAWSGRMGTRFPYWGAAGPLCAKPVIPRRLSTRSSPRPQRVTTTISWQR